MRWRGWFLALLLGSMPLGCAADQSYGVDERRVQELESENAKLLQDIGVLEQRLAFLMTHSSVYTTTAYANVCPPSIDAYVLDVNRELKLVVLNKGKKDHVNTGYSFSIYKGTKYKGQVRIQDVQDAMSTGLIVAEKDPIERGDSATTNL